MKMHVEFENLDDIAEFVKAWTSIAPAQVVTDVTPPVTKKKKPPKQKDAAEDTPPAEPEDAADQDEAETTDQTETEAEGTDTAENSATEEKVYTLEEVRGTLAALNKAGKRAEVKALLASFGVDKLSEIPKEQYGEVMAKAGEL